MPVQKPWLESLTLDKLQRLAVLIGAPCSGTKTVRIAGIREAIAKAASYEKPSTGLSLLSIDMGIRNLAFTHIKAPAITDLEGSSQYGKPKIEAWQRLSVSNSQELPADMDSGKAGVWGEGDGLGSLSPQLAKARKESFEPIDFATHAYKFIDHMLRKYNPNQILIERQRFRTGGQSAVQEWTIRVGVFEGMLYAVLRALAEERKLHLQVEPMQPARVNKSWLEGSPSIKMIEGKRLSSRDVKQAKIGLVCEMLEETGTKSRFTVSKQLRPLTDGFVSVWKKETKTRKPTSNGIGKLDDLADSLLQGLYKLKID
jgi:cruciform cutting endonuclease 1